jgi:hypothetical protein
MIRSSPGAWFPEVWTGADEVGPTIRQSKTTRSKPARLFTLFSPSEEGHRRYSLSDTITRCKWRMEIR